MSTPTNTTDQRAKARRYEANFRAFGRGLAKFTDGPIFRDDDVEVYSAPFQSVFNAYLPPRWSGNACEAKLAAALRLGKQTGRGMDIIVGPSANADALRPLLIGHGIKCAYWVPFMHYDLGGKLPRPKSIEGVSIEPTDDLSIFDDHPHPYNGPMTTARRRGQRDYQHELCRKGKARQIVAWLDGKPVGTVLVFAHRGSAGVYDMGVLEAHRGRGIGSAVMLTALREAREMGMDCAVLSAAGKAVPLYTRLGFDDAGHYGSYYIGKARLAKLKV